MRRYDGNPGRPHAYWPHPRSIAARPPCKCGVGRSHRIHQSWWWRLLNWRETRR